MMSKRSRPPAHDNAPDLGFDAASDSENAFLKPTRRTRQSVRKPVQMSPLRRSKAKTSQDPVVLTKTKNLGSNSRSRISKAQKVRPNVRPPKALQRDDDNETKSAAVVIVTQQREKAPDDMQMDRDSNGMPDGSAAELGGNVKSVDASDASATPLDHDSDAEVDEDVQSLLTGQADLPSTTKRSKRHQQQSAAITNDAPSAALAAAELAQFDYSSGAEHSSGEGVPKTFEDRLLVRRRDSSKVSRSATTSRSDKATSKRGEGAIRKLVPKKRDRDEHRERQNLRAIQAQEWAGCPFWDDEENSRRLLNHWSRLKGVFAEARGLLRHARDQNFIVKDSEIQRVEEMIQENMQAHAKLRDGNDDNTNDDQSLALPGLHLILSTIRRFYGQDDDHPTEYRNDRRCRGIVFNTIPNLIKLLRRSIECYAAIDECPPSSGLGISLNHLHEVSGLLAATVQLGLAAKKKYDRHEDVRGNLKLLHSNIIIPLRQVHKAFQDYEGQVQRDLHNQESRMLRREASAAEDEEAKRRETLRAAIQAKREEWGLLHVARREAEGICYHQAKIRHLAFEDTAGYEVDNDGHPFERVEMFGPTRIKVGPTPSQVRHAQDQEWSTEEDDVLLSALQNFAGRKDVYPVIFKMHCKRKGVLNRFNVSEIVTRAADFKVLWEREAEEIDIAVPMWVQQIPVWTKPHALGKENEV